MYILAVFVALLAIAHGDTPDKEQTAAIIKSCRESSGWTGEMGSKEITKERKCFMECGMKKVGVMAADGKINKDLAVEMGLKYVQMAGKTGDPQKYKEAVDECHNKLTPNPDHCEIAFQFKQCFKEKIGEA